MKKLVFACFAALLMLVSFSARADGVSDCVVGGLIAGGIAQMTGSRNVGGAAAVGCGGGTITGRVLERRDSAPVYAPPPAYQYPQQQRRQQSVYMYQEPPQPEIIDVPPVCDKYRYDQGILVNCTRAYARERDRIAQENRANQMQQANREAVEAARNGGN